MFSNDHNTLTLLSHAETSARLRGFSVAEFLQKQTGFTGSAALLAIQGNRKTLFVDARYTLQAQTECPNCAIITCASASLQEKAVQDWLQTQLPEGTSLTYDPRNLSVAEQKSLREAFPEVSLHAECFVETAPDEVLLLEDYPFAGRSAQDKIETLQSSLKAGEGVLLASPESIAWLLNLRSRAQFTPVFPSLALVTSDQVTVWLPPCQRRVQPPQSVKLRQVPWEEVPQELELETRKLERIFFDPQMVSVQLYEVLKGQTKVSQPDPTIEARCIKTPAEIEAARKIHPQEGAALIRLMACLKSPDCPLTTEGQVAKALEILRQEIPAYRGPSFPSIVACGANAAVVHYAPSNEGSQLKTGVLLLDVGGQYDGATTDLTRTLWLGATPPSAALVASATRVLKGHIALAQAIFPEGTSGAQLDVLARQFLWQAGQDYAHGTGHGVGNCLAVHEGPFGFSRRSIRPLRSGLILSNEPGFYETGTYGIRLENLMVVRSSKPGFLAFDVLTKVPFDPDLIDATQLTTKEKAWLRDYHRDVLQETAPFLDHAPKAHAWLKQVCQKFEEI